MCLRIRITSKFQVGISNVHKCKIYQGSYRRIPILLFGISEKIVPLDYDYTFAIKHGDDSLFIYKNKENGEVILGMDANSKPINKVPQWVELFDFYTPDEADNILLKTFGCYFIEVINKINLISIIDGK